MNTYIKIPPPLSHRPHTMGKCYSFIPDNSIAPFKVHFKVLKSEVLPTTAIDTVSEFTRRSATGTVSEGLVQGPWCGGKNRIQTHDLPVQRHRLNQCATTPHEY